MADSLTPLVRRILSVYRSSTEAQIEAGLNWYSDALGISEDIADAWGLSTERVAGIIAALSPQNSYGANLNLARRFVASGGTLDRGYLGLGLGKARDIWNGADVVETLNAPKTVNFFRSIISGGTEGVCIDRHAYALAYLTRDELPKLTPKRYAFVASAYVRAAERVQDATPAQVQAVTWVTWRQRYWSEGAFDPRA